MQVYDTYFLNNISKKKMKNKIMISFLELLIFRYNLLLLKSLFR